MPVITEEIDGRKGRYVLRTEAGEAEMTFSIASDALRIVDHTGVPEAMRGTGAGRALVEHLVADARAKGFRVVPLCPFVNALRRKHPDWADVFKV
ncbi:MAG: GNAT family N-acetyltransferase [Pseudomonadota bacterium]